MKKFIAFVMVAVMLLGSVFALASCGESEELVVGITYFAPMN